MTWLQTSHAIISTHLLCHTDQPWFHAWRDYTGHGYQKVRVTGGWLFPSDHTAFPTEFCPDQLGHLIPLGQFLTWMNESSLWCMSLSSTWNFNVPTDLLSRLWKRRCWFSRSWVQVEILHSNKLPGDASALGPWTTFWVAKCSGRQASSSTISKAALKPKVLSPQGVLASSYLAETTGLGKRN